MTAICRSLNRRAILIVASFTPSLGVSTLPTAIEERLSAALLAERYQAIRQQTVALCAPLSPEDAVQQSMTDASPAKWHLAHTTWFFETFVLERALPDFQPVNPAYRVLFNSYYQGVGPQHSRPARGMLTRPSLDEVNAYRQSVDRHLETLLENSKLTEEQLAVCEVGLHHEQQHQELILTDIKHLLSLNPTRPSYRADLAESPDATPPPKRWHHFDSEVVWIGAPEGGFAYDNERPRHRVILEAFELASRPVTAGEYLEFIEEGGYTKPELWMSDGWAKVTAAGWQAPLYWHQLDGDWHHFTLGGLRPLSLGAPVCHLSYYEADAFARWAGARLPTEAEWEHAATTLGSPDAGNFLESGLLEPQPAAAGGTLAQAYGDVWEWTQSPYAAYPGFQPLAGALGEYNGKFMCNQMVLRGGSCATPASHIRATYRNFFYPHMRWQFAGVRLARG